MREGDEVRQGVSDERIEKEERRQISEEGKEASKEVKGEIIERKKEEGGRKCKKRRRMKYGGLKKMKRRFKRREEGKGEVIVEGEREEKEEDK